MNAISLREIRAFFSTIIGYLVVTLFLLINGFLLWFFDGSYNVLQSGFADLSPFFSLAPWVLIFLIPAVSMKSFSEEIKSGTIELLLTKPLSVWQIVLGKYLGIFVLMLLAIIPTLVYVFVLQDLVLVGQSMDYSGVIGSFIGLLFLASCYISMGVFASSLTSNQIVAFLLAVIFCLFMSLGVDLFATLLGEWFERLGVLYHYRSISRGVIDTRDLVYFMTLTVLCLGLTVFRIKTLRK